VSNLFFVLFFVLPEQTQGADGRRQLDKGNEMENL